MEICKIAFFCEYQYLGFFKSRQTFSGALEFSFVFQILTLEVEKYRFKQKSEK